MKKTIKYISIVGVIVIAIFIIGYFLFADKNMDSDDNVASMRQDHSDIIASKALASGKIIKIDSVETYEEVSKYGKLANCLRGTDIDGGFAIDKNGKLIISKDIVRLFEYFMSARSEEIFETRIARIEEYIQLTLPYEAQKEALSILYDYLDYKEALGKEMGGKSSPSEYADNIDRARNIMQERNNIRKKYLTPEVIEAFFSDEEAYDKYVLDRVSLEQNNTSRTEDEKLKMIENMANNSNLPEPYKEKVIFEEKEKILENKIVELRKQGDNEDTIYKLRTDLYGKEIADGLTANDKTRQEWENRFNAYYKTKTAILNSTDLREDEKEQKIIQLQERSFTSKEYSLLKLYESAKEEKSAQNLNNQSNK